MKRTNRKKSSRANRLAGCAPPRAACLASRAPGIAPRAVAALRRPAAAAPEARRSAERGRPRERLGCDTEEKKSGYRKSWTGYTMALRSFQPAIWTPTRPRLPA